MMLINSLKIVLTPEEMVFPCLQQIPYNFRVPYFNRTLSYLGGYTSDVDRLKAFITKSKTPIFECLPLIAILLKIELVKALSEYKIDFIKCISTDDDVVISCWAFPRETAKQHSISSALELIAKHDDNVLKLQSLGIDFSKTITAEELARYGLNYAKKR